MRGDVRRAVARRGTPSEVAPLDLVALAEENADLVPGGDAGEALAAALADRLLALDLPGASGARSKS